jgi:hypothetical protein
VGSNNQPFGYNKEGAGSCKKMEQCFPSIVPVKTPDLLFTLLLPEKSSSSYCMPVRFSSRSGILFHYSFLGRPWSSSFLLVPFCFPRCCFLERLWSPPFHLLSLCFLFFVRCRLVLSLMSISFFFFFFDFVYCSPDAAQFPLSCFSLNAYDDLSPFPLCTSYDTVNLYEALLCALHTCEKSVFLYALHLPGLYFQRSDLIVWLPLSIWGDGVFLYALSLSCATRSS